MKPVQVNQSVKSSALTRKRSTDEGKQYANKAADNLKFAQPHAKRTVYANQSDGFARQREPFDPSAFQPAPAIQ